MINVLVTKDQDKECVERHHPEHMLLEKKKKTT